MQNVKSKITSQYAYVQTAIKETLLLNVDQDHLQQPQLQYEEIHVSHRHVVHTANVEHLTNKQFAHAYLRTLALHLTVDRSAQSTLIVLWIVPVRI